MSDLDLKTMDDEFFNFTVELMESVINESVDSKSPEEWIADAIADDPNELGLSSDDPDFVALKDSSDWSYMLAEYRKEQLRREARPDDDPTVGSKCAVDWDDLKEEYREKLLGTETPPA